MLQAQLLPELPNTSGIETCFPDTTGYAVLTVGPAGRDYDDLQAAIDAANPGTVLVLDAGATFTGTFTLPNKTGVGWIVIMSSRMDLLPAQGNRIRPDGETGDSAYPTQQAAMPKIVTTNLSGQPCFRTQAAAHHYRLVGLEIKADTSVSNNYGLIFFGDASAAQSALNAVPHHLVVDRCYIHGHDRATVMKSGVLLNSASSAVLDSHISGFHSIGFDTYAIGGTNGPGPFVIRNNYLEAAGENILFGGAAPAIPNLVPADLEVRNNHFFKPFSWRVGHPDYAGKHWTIKNLFELKTGRRVLLDGNILENCWADLPTGQSGYAILLTVRNEGGKAPWADVSDVTISNNIIRHTGAGITLSGRDAGVSQQSKRIRIANNLFYNISGPDYGDGNIYGPNDGTFLKIGDPSDVLVEHNTVLQTGPVTWAYDTTLSIAFRDNIFHCFVSGGGYQGVYGPGFGPGGNGPMGRYFPGISDANRGFHQNLLIGGNAQHYSNYSTLSQNFFPANTGLMQFADYANGDADYHGFALSGNSPWKNAATGGTDLGVDVARLDSALNALYDCGQAVQVDSPVSAAADIRLDPNPFRNRLLLNSSSLFTNAELVLYDLTGREIFRVSGLSGQDILINTGRVTPGVCFGLLRQEGRVLHRQLLVAE